MFVSLYFAQVLREPRKIAAKALEATYASLQQTELLAGVIHEQDCRAIRTACCCLNSLRIRVEARANVTERAVISRQLLSRSLYRSHVLSTSFGPVLGAMMKQVCWHSRRSKAHRGLPEARPRTQNVMARGQSEAHGDSNLYNTRQD